MTEEELEKYIVRKDDEVTRILFAYEINAEGNMEWHKITKDMASKWKKDLNDVTDLPENSRTGEKQWIHQNLQDE